MPPSPQPQPHNTRPSRPRSPLAGPATPAPPFPISLSGPVIKGFGRGSRELGIPTANIPLAGLSVGGQSELESGDFYGARMNLLVCGFVRPEYDYVDKAGLIEDIRADMAVARRSLERQAYAGLRGDAYLVQFEGGEHEAEVAT
ncbi:MAG: hypothetical protein Q9185_003538 [Variospora sp. 1 TL-2023]